jgi:hypothetical protein
MDLPAAISTTLDQETTRVMMNPLLRKVTLTVHVSVSVGWLGAAAAYLAVAVMALVSGESATMRTAFPSLELIGWRVLVPLSVAALVSGLVQSFCTPWGLFRHYWVVAKLALTLVATAVMLGHMPVVSRAATLAERPTTVVSELGMLPTQLVIHAAGGMLVLLTITALSVLKPWGMTPVGKRWRQAAASVPTSGD